MNTHDAFRRTGLLASTLTIDAGRARFEPPDADWEETLGTKIHAFPIPKIYNVWFLQDLCEASFDDEDELLGLADDGPAALVAHAEKFARGEEGLWASVNFEFASTTCLYIPAWGGPVDPRALGVYRRAAALSRGCAVPQPRLEDVVALQRAVWEAWTLCFVRCAHSHGLVPPGRLVGAEGLELRRPGVALSEPPAWATYPHRVAKILEWLPAAVAAENPTARTKWFEVLRGAGLRVQACSRDRR